MVRYLYNNRPTVPPDSVHVASIFALPSLVVDSRLCCCRRRPNYNWSDGSKIAHRQRHGCCRDRTTNSTCDSGCSSRVVRCTFAPAKRPDYRARNFEQHRVETRVQMSLSLRRHNRTTGKKNNRRLDPQKSNLTPLCQRTAHKRRRVSALR